MIRVAINGFGRIGRNVLRACYEGGYNDRIQIVAINDLGSPEINAHLLRHDTVHGHFGRTVAVTEHGLLIDGDTIQVFAERNPEELPWESLEIDLVMECTGLFTKRPDASKHLAAGAKRVLVSAPGTDMDATVVHGVNHQILSAEHRVISNASCTTNCLAPIAKALHSAVGIESGLANTVHAYTNDQVLNDIYHTDLRRARSATQSMIPSKTGAAAAIGDVIPELRGKLDGLSVRVPVINTSLLDLTFKASRSTSVEEINHAVEEAAHGEMGSVLAVNDLPLVSTDFNHNPASSIFDKTQTKVIGDQVKILAWYDNEWGFSNRMLDNALVIGDL
ncbi:type I glyceraldehyde-3-phosphate dehydrogenase [Porticoccus sp. W117]|uniref:type I glyceraldehyde-3-phosphate dehydrogenase n=1 Tax=Porticoccus sp. W117 TaxID=3054777 RepID=UPI0025921D55|nr:type I glyceraldehyde-3-phosphate dehydrogenase [Porticoccus sp. W117]MDM3870048.1 type I glyceraldehyde-3-phosphate dehydrogenase [Porticoccus sp. W117]